MAIQNHEDDDEPTQFQSNPFHKTKDEKVATKYTKFSEEKRHHPKIPFLTSWKVVEACQTKMEWVLQFHDFAMPTLQNLGGSLSDLFQVVVMGKPAPPKRQTVAMVKSVPKGLASPSEPVGVAAQHRSETMRGLSKLRAPKARKSLLNGVKGTWPIKAKFIQNDSHGLRSKND